MIRFKKFINEFDAPKAEPISKKELDNLERVLDNLFASLNIDIKFTKHFHDRLNDPRNKKQITTDELIDIYASLYQKFGNKISKAAGDVDKLIKSIATNINIPVNIRYDRRKKEVVIVAMTAMRKKSFKTKDATLQVEAAFDPSSFLPTQTNKVELFLGRMQPVHLGHESIIKKMKNPIVALVKGTASSQDKDRNPLSAKDQIRFLKKLFPSIKIIEVPTGFVPDIINQIRQGGDEVSVVYAGDDRINSYKGMISGYNKKLSDDQQMIATVKKTPRVTSASAVRDAIRSGDEEAFKKMMPKKLHGEYEYLRGLIK